MDFDLAVFHWVNGFVGRWPAVDVFWAYEEDNFLFKGGIFLAVYAFFWFRPAAAQEAHRRIVLNAFLAVAVALVLNRALSLALPFRVRPMYDPASGALSPAVAVSYNLEGWSSFPSDTATFFFTLAVGTAYFSRIVGILLALYTFFYICASRVYLGIHYPSDILVGALLGAATMPLVNGALRGAVADPLIAFERRAPHWFYLLALPAAFEVATMFHDVRHLYHTLAHALNVRGRDLIAALLDPLLGTLAVLGVAACGGLLLVHRHRGH